MNAIHRVTQTKGIMLLSDDEIEEMVTLAKKWAGWSSLYWQSVRVQHMTPALRSIPKKGKKNGLSTSWTRSDCSCYRDVKRAISLGCRSFLVYDEGCLWLLNEMRKQREIPSECRFKVSAHCGHGNPCSKLRALA